MTRLTRYFEKDPQEIRLSVSAVVWRDGRRRRSGEFLLMQRSDNGHWGLPGGYVEVGESVHDAAVREVFEETGVEVELGRLIGVYSDPQRQVVAYPDRRIQAINLCFEAMAVGQGRPTTPEETLDSGYFSWDGLPEPMVPIHGIRIEDALDGGTEARVR